MSAFIQRKCDWGIKKTGTVEGFFKFRVICEEHPGGSQNFFYYSEVVLCCAWSLYGTPELSMLQALIESKAVTGLSRGNGTLQVVTLNDPVAPFWP